MAEPAHCQPTCRGCLGIRVAVGLQIAAALPLVVGSVATTWFHLRLFESSTDRTLRFRRRGYDVVSATGRGTP